MSKINTDITLGILGGGQLGRMSAMAAARLGIAVIIFSPENDCPASYVAKETIAADYDDKEALEELSNKTDIITYEFENIPLETIKYLEELKPNSVLPEKTLLEVSQDRIKEKTFLNHLNIKTTRWEKITDIDCIIKTFNEWNCDDFILKTSRFGYDGKGQIKCNSLNVDENEQLLEFIKASKDCGIIMEEIVPFTKEISIIIARDYTGKTAIYGPMLNEHKNHILYKTTIPCELHNKSKELALNVSETIAKAVNLRGILTVEFFVCHDDSILVNEIAPRTHNSGHWSIDACCVSQFENHIRSVCGLPIGSPKRHSNAVMLNLIGDEVKNIDQYIEDDFSNIHLYGKKQIKSGRKMGHITILTPKTIKNKEI